MNFHYIFSIVVFIVTFIFISTEKINKTVAALCGAFLFILSSIIDQKTAFLEIDWNVIFLLIGMMIIVGITKTTGLFQFAAIKMAKLAKGNPYKILIYLCILTAVFSAFLDNVTTVLILTPITILISVELGLSPIPFVIAEIISSNIGGTATLIGDPPNIMIGSSAKLGFMDFIINLSPIVIILLISFLIVTYFLWGKQMQVSNQRKARIMEFNEYKFFEDKKLLYKSIFVLILVMSGFLFHSYIHLEAATIAMSGASLLLLISGKKELHKLFEEIEWETIFFFIGLFILVGGIVETGVIKQMSEMMISLTQGNIQLTSFVVLWSAGIFSGIIDNIPFVATMIPIIEEFSKDPLIMQSAITPLWWSLSLGACLGGNATLIGASANVVAAGIAGKSGYKISFWEFTKYGFVITILNLLLCNAYIYLRYFLI